MIDNNELISTLRERAALYAYGSADSMACTAAANALEAQAREIEQHDIEYSVRGLLLLDTERERDQLRAELAALQCEDELPTPDGYLFSRPGISKIDVSPHGGDWERLYSEAKLRQAQAMVRAKMVAATVAPAQPAQDVNAELVSALKLAIEYWDHRQQRYKNRCPVWVQDAQTALANAKAAPQQEQKGGAL